MDIQNPFLKRHLSKILLLLLFLIILVAFNMGRIKQRLTWAFKTDQEKIDATTPVKDTPSVSNPNPIDTNEVIKRYSALIDSLELSWGTDRVNIQRSITKMAGVTGKVTWEYDISPKDYKDNPDIFIANGSSINPDDPAKKDMMLISLLVNSRTGVFKVLSAKRNGEKLKGIILITTLALEGGYSTSTTN